VKGEAARVLDFRNTASPTLAIQQGDGDGRGRFHPASTRVAPDHQTKDSVMEYGPLVAVLSLMLTALGVGIAIGLALH
jgi:hypothetical protein